MTKEEHINLWKRLSTKVVYENPWIKVNHDEVITPRGFAGIYGRVNFKNLAIAIVPIDADGFTWLVGQYRYTIDQYSWEVVEGGGPLNEDPLVSAQRELQEEIGGLAKKWELIHEFYTSNSVCNEKSLVYIARDLTFTEKAPDETELLKVRKIHITKAIEMAYNNEINESLAAIALMKTDYLIRTKKLII